MTDKEILELLTRAIIGFKQDSENTKKDMAFRYLLLSQIYLKEYMKGNEENEISQRT